MTLSKAQRGILRSHVPGWAVVSHSLEAMLSFERDQAASEHAAAAAELPRAQDVPAEEGQKITEQFTRINLPRFSALETNLDWQHESVPVQGSAV